MFPFDDVIMQHHYIAYIPDVFSRLSVKIGCGIKGTIRVGLWRKSTQQKYRLELEMVTSKCTETDRACNMASYAVAKGIRVMN